MFESGYFIPYVAEKFTATPDNHSLIGSAISQYLNNTNVSPWTHVTIPRSHTLQVGLGILFLATIIIVPGPFIQTLLSFCRLSLRRRTSPTPKQRRTAIMLLTFISCWLLLSVALILILIVFSENIHFTDSQSHSFVSRVDDTSNRTFVLLRVLTNETTSVVNDTIHGLMDDFYNDMLLEIPTIIAHLLNRTNLDTPLTILANLSQAVEDLLNAHIHLRENGPEMTLELEKLDSSIRANGEMLSEEIQRTWKLCTESTRNLPSLKPFREAISHLVTGLHSKQDHKNNAFFHLFGLESSLGLFNMLNVLPFNISETTDQLKRAVTVREELIASIRSDVKQRFSLMSNEVANRLDSLSTYVDKALMHIDEMERSYHETLDNVNGTLRRLEKAWIMVYFIGLMVMTAPLVLLFCSCFCPRQRIERPVQETFSLLSIHNLGSVSSSGCGSYENVDSTVIPISTEDRQSGGLIQSPSTGAFPHAQGLFVKRTREISISCDSDSGYPRSDFREAGFWPRTHTTYCGFKVKSRRCHGCHCQTGYHRRHLYKACAHQFSCCALFLLSLICLPLIFSIGYFHVHVCLPLVPNSPQQLQLDRELNAIVENSWKDWMHPLSDSMRRHLRALGDTQDVNFNLMDHLRVEYPRNLVAALLTRCSPSSGKESFFSAISFKVEFNLTGVLDVPVIKNKSNEFRGYFVDQAVRQMLEKLDEGLLPPNFELLLQSLIAQSPNTTSEEAGSPSALDTAERFWLQAIGGAAEREKAVTASITSLHKNRQLLRQVMLLRRELEEELTRAPNISNSCSTRLSQALRISNYGLRLIRSTRKRFRFEEQLESLLNSAITLHRISKLPSFTKSLADFAQLAFSMGLSKTSTNASIDGLLQCVNQVMGLEYDRLVSAFERHYVAKSVNARITAALNRLTAPCQRLGALAWEIIDSTCIVAPSPASPPLPISRSQQIPQATFPPIVQRMAAVGLAILLLICIPSSLSLVYMCITKSLACRTV